MMRRSRSNRIILIAILLVAVLGISVAFAALSQQLSISASTNIKGGSWSILFDNLEPYPIGTAEDNSSVITGGTTISLNATFLKPGDKVTYTFDVVNNGTINAVLNEKIITGMFEQYPEIKYSLTYNNDFDYGNAEPNNGDFLNVGESRNIKLEIWFDSSETTVSEEDRTLTFSINLVYIQSQ